MVGAAAFIRYADTVVELDAGDGALAALTEMTGTPTSSATPSPDHEYIGAYQLLAELGRGGVARVVRARHIHPSYADRTYAIKILHPIFAHDAQVRRLFQGEAYLLALLDHPNIVRTFEAGEEDGQLFIAMEAISGRDLLHLMQRCRQAGQSLPREVALHILAEVLRALCYAHALRDVDGAPLGVIHRDVNPSNVFLSYGGHVKLGDFGVASLVAHRAAREQWTVGKPGYFAPEQLAGDPVDQRADLFAFGATAYELLCGRHPFSSNDPEEVLELNRKAKYPLPRETAPDLSREVEAFLVRALERKPRKRFDTAQQMLAVLEPELSARASMRLALRSLMRSGFLAEHVQELQLRDGLAGSEAARGAAACVTLVTRRREVSDAVTQTLAARAMHVELVAPQDAVALSASAKAGGCLVLWDLASGDAPAVGKVAAFPGQCPLVALADSLAAPVLAQAVELGACDLLVLPFSQTRLHSAVWVAARGLDSMEVLEVASSELEAKQRYPGARLLVVGASSSVRDSCAAALAEASYRPMVVDGVEAAVDLMTRQSFRAAVLCPAAEWETHLPRAVARLRAPAGISLLPVVVVQSAPLAADAPLGVGAVAPSALGEELAAKMAALLVDTRHGRSFARFDTSFRVDLGYSGRNIPGEVTNASRGGVFMRCTQMPPLGTGVRLSLRVPGAERPLEAQGRVVRVHLPESADVSRAGVGVEFAQFSGADETLFLAFLASMVPVRL
ncbi:MAG: protein kinase [Myxococcota bacterium]